MTKESFLIYKSFYEPISGLSDEDMGKLFRAIFLYQLKQIEPTNTDRIYMAFQFFKNQFRLDEVKYCKVVNRNRKNGLNGGRPKTQTNSNNPVGFPKPKKADNDNEKDNDIFKDINKTSLEDVIKAFTKVRETIWNDQYIKLQSQKFYDFYSSKGWMVGKNKMKSLQHAVSGWATRCDTNEPQNKVAEPIKGSADVDQLTPEQKLRYGF